MIDDLTKGIGSLLKEAEQLKGILEKRFSQVEKDIEEKIVDKDMQDYLKNSLSLARENKLNLADFLNNVKEKCQQKS